jgi:dinuclear metal center YbgI/SA1388 family protein
MPESLIKLVRFLDQTLEVDAFPDSGPMGLQVYGREAVENVVTAVSASRALFERAVDEQANMVIVHHGLFWNSDSRAIDQLLRERLRLLFDHDISLVSYHLALDGHPTLGNNARIIEALGFKRDNDGFAHTAGRPIGWFASSPNPLAASQLAHRVTSFIGPLHANYANGPDEVRRIAVCSGGGPRYLREAVALGCDAFITGDLFEPAEMWSRELNVHLLAAGHYATEVFGVKALAELLNQTRDCSAMFVDLSTNA